MIKNEREYRNFQIERREGEQPENDYKVRGYASTFEPYVLFDDGETTIYERVDPTAFDEADMTDVIFLYNHQGMVYARQKNGTLTVSTDTHGLFTEADLSSTSSSRELYEAIRSGLIDQMSFAFTVADDSYDKKTHTRTIHRIAKVYDVSAVSIPANPGTDIAAVSARSYADGVIDAERAERLAQEQALKLAKAKYHYMEVKHD